MTCLHSLLVALAFLVVATRLVAAILRAATVALDDATRLIGALDRVSRALRRFARRRHQRRHSS